jgi:hypothetical protein
MASTALDDWRCVRAERLDKLLDAHAASSPVWADWFKTNLTGDAASTAATRRRPRSPGTSPAPA